MDFIPLNKSSSHKPGAGRAPRAKICYVCGRQTLIAGYDYHVEKCRELFDKREALKPPKERRKIKDPFNNVSSGMKGISIDEHNKLSHQAFTENLVSCLNCGRNFLPEKLEIHNRSCTSSNPSRRVNLSFTTKETTKTIGLQDNFSEMPRSVRSNKYSDNANIRNSIDDKFAAKVFETSFIPAELHQCASCGRTFNEIAYSKHIKICDKVFIRQRKPYDSSKHRITGTDIEDFANQSKRRTGIMSSRGGGGGKSTSSRKISKEELSQQCGNTENNWRIKSENFRNAMKLARTVARAEQQSKATGIPLHHLIPSTTHDDPIYDTYIECPTCGRKFSEKAGTRHIPQCKNIIAKPKRLLAHSGELATSFSYSGSNSNTLPVSSLRSSNTNASKHGTSKSIDIRYRR